MNFTALTQSRLSRAIHLAFALIGVSATAQAAISANTSAALAERSADCAIVPLGKLEGFWRYSAALGPFHEEGHGLDVVPDCMLHGDFPYVKRPYAREALFADHLSMVRILGGFSDEGKEGTAVQQRDLAYRDASGKIHYRMELLEPRLKPYLDNGYTDLTVVLDNVPWCFPEKPQSVHLGQKSPPRDAQEWSAFIQQVCRELVRIMGREQANRLRFRVGTENGSRKRFDGTHADYVRHYENTAAAVRSILPNARVGCYNISGVSLKAMNDSHNEGHNVNALELAKYCCSASPQAIPFDWVAFSRYYRPGDDPRVHAAVCGDVWDAFESRVPKLKGISREIQEFGIAPWSEVKEGTFTSAEPGVLGAALTCQMMLRLREVGVDRLWHWSVLDLYRNAANKLVKVPTGGAWLLSILETMRGGEAFLLSPVKKSPHGTKHLALAVRLGERVIVLFSSYNPDASVHASERVSFTLPEQLANIGNGKTSYVRLDRESSVHDTIRKDLVAAQLLHNDFINRPDRLGTIRQMGLGKEAEKLIGSKQDAYDKLWIESLTLKLTERDACSFSNHEVTLDLPVPGLFVLSIAPSSMPQPRLPTR